MLQSFGIAFNAVMPFMVYLAIGFISVRMGLADEPFMKRLNKLTFRMVFPFLTFQNIYGASPETMPSLKLMMTALISVLAVIAVLMTVVPRLVKENPRRGVIIQAIYRSNFVMYGIPLTAYVYGAEQSGAAGMMVLAVIVLYNISAAIVLETFNGSHGVNIRNLVLSLLKNPMLHGCFLGILFYLLGLQLPSFLERPVSSLANMATPLALITLGGSLRYDSVRKNRSTLVPVLTMKLIFLPALMLGISWMVGLRGVELFLMLMVYATPVGASSYPMAVNMGGDGELAGQLVFISTAVSLLTVFTFIFAMSQMGIL